MLRPIRELYYATRKEREPLWTKYLSRPFGAALAYALRDTRVTPNQVSILAFLTACVGAAVMVAWTDHAGLIVAVLIYQLAYIIDCADGMLARLRRTASKAGHLLDFLGDELKAEGFFAAVAVRLYLCYDDPRILLAGIGGLAMISMALALTTFLRRPEVTGEPSPVEDADAAPSPRRSLLRRLVGLVEWAAKTAMNYPTYVVILGIFNIIEVYFALYLAVYALYVARTSLQLVLKLGRPLPARPTPTHPEE